MMELYFDVVATELDVLGLNFRTEVLFRGGVMGVVPLLDGFVELLLDLGLLLVVLLEALFRLGFVFGSGLVF